VREVWRGNQGDCSRFARLEC